MGVASPREKIESEMLKLKYRRVEIEEERNERIKQLKNLTGREINRPSIPDYIETDDINSNQSQNHSTKSDKMKGKNNKIKKGTNNKKNLIDNKNDNKRKKNEKENNFEKKSKKGSNIKNNKDKKHHFHQVTKE